MFANFLNSSDTWKPKASERIVRVKVVDDHVFVSEFDMMEFSALFAYRVQKLFLEFFCGTFGFFI